jgi:hypothetical protein
MQLYEVITGQEIWGLSDGYLFLTHHSAFCSSPIQALPPQLTACNAVTCQYRAFKSHLFKLVDIHRKTVPVPLKYPDLIGKLADKKNIPVHRVKVKFIADQS